VVAALEMSRAAVLLDDPAPRHVLCKARAVTIFSHGRPGFFQQRGTRTTWLGTPLRRVLAVRIAYRQHAEVRRTAPWLAVIY
jgi:hypothetical protein